MTKTETKMEGLKMKEDEKDSTKEQAAREAVTKLIERAPGAVNQIIINYSLALMALTFLDDNSLERLYNLKFQTKHVQNQLSDSLKELEELFDFLDKEIKKAEEKSRG